MIVHNQQNLLADDGWNVLIFTMGWGIFDNGSVESDSMDRSDVNYSV